MASGNVETESKFWVSDISVIEERLHELGAEVVEVRGFESNIRFDTPDSAYTRDRKVVRLRKYHDNRLTYKGPSKVVGGAMSRVEIETIVSDHENTRLILAALGFIERAVYEKYRAMMRYKGCLVTLDELPYGNFVEIEGSNGAEISTIAIEIGLDAQKAIPASYQGIFERLRDLYHLNAKNLRFGEIQPDEVDLRSLGYELADRPR